jgi:EAL domain-containing protein (putative c-di-GMP-specific phosphodiesterase class I)
VSGQARQGGASPSIPAAGWYLETLDESGVLRRYRIRTLPFRIGRRHGLDLVLPADSVSKAHAEIYALGSGLRLRDLGSRNGTFLNRGLVEDAALREGDVVHFADFEFRLGRSEGTEDVPTPAGGLRPTTVAHHGPRPHRFEKGTRELRELLRDGQVTMVFQPIVLLSRGTVAAYEALGRGRHDQLPEGPLELLKIAESIGKEAELSRLFRRKAVELAARRTDLPTLFLNTHPSELSQRGLIESLDELREIAPTLDLALEIHESVLTSPATIAELRKWLAERNIALAYDDFGAREDRRNLLELSDAQPHYLKFDQRYIKDLDKASEGRRRLLHSFLDLARELLVKTIAEGIETAAEARACAELGFTHGQGFYVGRARSIEQL